VDEPSRTDWSRVHSRLSRPATLQSHKLLTKAPSTRIILASAEALHCAAPRDQPWYFQYLNNTTENIEITFKKPAEKEMFRYIRRRGSLLTDDR